MAGKPHNWRPDGTRHERGYGTAHDRIRRALLRDEPNCREYAKAEVVTKATHADHVIPRCEGGPDIRANYQPLCEKHSRTKSAREGNRARYRRHRDRGK